MVYMAKLKSVLLHKLLGSFVVKDEKGKRCKAFAVPATVSTARFNASSHCVPQRTGRHIEQYKSGDLPKRFMLLVLGISNIS